MEIKIDIEIVCETGMKIEVDIIVQMVREI